MRTWEELGIKFGGHISIDEIIPGDVIELDYKVGNRRGVVQKVQGDYFNVDNSEVISKNNPDIVGVIRGFPGDDEMRELVKEKGFCIDIPDTTRDISPVFVSDMIRRFQPDTPYRFITIFSEGGLDKYGLHCNGYYFNKRWILWDSLKFYAVGQKVSYFI